MVTRGKPTRLARLLILASLVLAGASCGGDDAGDPSTQRTEEESSIEGEITVFAASSLTDAFKELGEAFTRANSKAEVTFNFGASSALATQINEGAPADVFASADLAQMKAVTDRGNAAESAVFVKNTPVVVVPKGSTAVATFNDLAKPGVKLVLAAPEVPIGRYSRDILARASGADGISAAFSDKTLANLKSNEANVRAVLTKVQLGEADAGIIYKTDVGAAAGEVKVIEIPAAFNIVAEYPIAALKQTKNRAAADAFVAFVRSAAGAAILEKHGFVKP